MSEMRIDTNFLIANLVDDLRPVRPLRLSDGLGLALGGLVLALAYVGAQMGLRADLLGGRIEPVVLISAGLFFLLGLAASVTTIMMGRPRVGSDHGGWKWATAMTATLPLAAVVSGIGRANLGLTGTAADDGLGCLVEGTVLGLATFAVLVMWLRRGAPTSPERSGLLAGLAAGGFGIFAFSFHCAYSDIVHIGIWHGGAVVLSAALGRLVVPQLIRW